MNKSTDSVRIVLFDQSDRFLVLAETDDPDNWKLPGGKFDSVDETPDAAASRELQEELGTNAADVQLTQAGQLVNNDGVSARTIPDSPNKDHILSAVQLAQNGT